MRRAAAGWVVAALIGGCEQPRTELVVGIESEVAWGPGQAVQSVVLSVRRGGADGPLRSVRTTVLGAEVGQQVLPLYVGVIAAGDDTDTPVWIEALGCGDPSGCSSATAVVAQRAVVRLVRGETQELPLLLAAACPGGTCASDERCATGGRCEPATRAQETVRPFAGFLSPHGADAAADVPMDVMVTSDVDASDATGRSDSDGRPGDAARLSEDVLADTGSGSADSTTDGTVDAGVADVVPAADDGAPSVDAAGVDGGGGADAGVVEDVPRTAEAGTTDVGAPDVGPPDAGTRDVGAPDVGPRDASAVDVGTPDAGAQPCSGSTCPCSPSAPTGWCAVGATCLSGACVAGPLAGALVITEFMSDPVATNDMAGEWFELYNRSETSVDLRGLRVRGSGTEMFDVTATGPVLVPGHGYAVLGINGDTATNGGVTMSFAYGSAMTLGNGSADVVSLLASDGTTLIDSVTYGTTAGSGWPVVAGRSKSLRPAILDAAMNDTAAAWCAGGPAFGRGDFGTPGAANVCQ